MANQTTKLPPQNIEAEQSLLGALLIDKEAIIKVAEVLTPTHFYRTEQHGKIFGAILDLFEKREPIDLVTVTDKLKQTESIDIIGGSAYLTTLVNLVPTSAHIEHYARIIKEHAIRRNLISKATRLIEQSYDESIPLEQILENAEQDIFSISQESIKRDFVPLKDLLTISFDRLDELQKSSGKLRGVPTGFKDLDNTLAGMQESNLIIIAARPGIGKTSLILNIAEFVAVKANLPVGIFSLEMSQEELVDRIIVSRADIDAWKLKTGKLDEKDFDKLSHAYGELAEAPLFIDDTPGLSLAEIRTKARRLQMEHGLRLLVIDYLQLVHGRNLENRVQEVSEISQGFKNLARELKIPVIAVSQLSRAVEQRGTRKPQLADLRESGCLTGDSLLVRVDTGERIAIKDLVGKSQIPVFSLNSDLKLEIKLISKVFSSGRKKIFKLTTRDGRTIKASANHPFYTIDGWKRLDKLEIGMHLGVPRSLTPIIVNSALSSNEIILLAHLLGDGCVLPRQPVHYTSADMENIQIVGETCQKLFGIKPRLIKQENWYHLYLPSPYRLARGKHNPIINWLQQLGLNPVRSFEKILPSALFRCSNKDIRLFLHHLWSTDGNISWKKGPNRKLASSIYYSTTSKTLAEQLQHLLLRLGIIGTLRTVPSRTIHKNYQIHIQGAEMQLLFCSLVGSYGLRGRIVPKIIKALEQITQNPNLDIIPKQIWHSTIQEEKIAANLGWREVSQLMNTSYCGSTLFKSGLSRKRLGNLALKMDSKILKNLAESDIYWDELIGISYLGVEEVFDATVPETHNFVANDFVVHNSIEQDADVVMFIYREDPENLQDITLAIEKHRNGPTREIKLMFFPERVKFYGMEKTRAKAE